MEKNEEKATEQEIITDTPAEKKNDQEYKEQEETPAAQDKDVKDASAAAEGEQMPPVQDDPTAREPGEPDEQDITKTPEAASGETDIPDIPQEPVPDQEISEEVTTPVDESIDSEFEQLLEESLVNIQEINVGDKVEGQISNITDSYIFVSLGGKRDVYAEKADYLDKDGNLPYKVGDNLTGYVVKYTETETFIAKSLVSVNKSVLREAFEEKIPVNGKVLSTIRGGFLVNISGVRAFCPQSQIDTRIVKDIQQYIGQNYDFRIIDFRESGRNIVLSRRALLEEEMERMKHDTLGKLEQGSVIKGRVTRLTNFGAFIDLGGVEGLVHISEFSWTRIESPSDVLNIGDEIRVKVIKMEGEKISLSMKALQSNPFEKAIEGLKEGDTVTCRIVRNLPFGSFAELKPGVEGLIPVSEMAIGRRINHPSEIISEGDMVEAQVMKINSEEKKLSLSLKALQPDPWNNIDEILQEDEIITGIIENVVNFGAFITLKEGVVGLMPSSKIKLAGLKIDKSNIGEEFTVRVVSVDKEGKRISLEPTNIPESPVHDQDDWRKYRKDKKEIELEDSPFADL
ncbi:MAG: S1 RNA-binding domain-containing protein [Candidatus Cloacimonetes bacterium]|nr:S1 RNA-binding domain-containing protein [Candidatus Cloacimonadota bacterium]